MNLVNHFESFELMWHGMEVKISCLCPFEHHTWSQISVAQVAESKYQRKVCSEVYTFKIVNWEPRFSADSGNCNSDNIKQKQIDNCEPERHSHPNTKKYYKGKAD